MAGSEPTPGDTKKSGLPYRPCVGIIVVNPKGKVLMGSRDNISPDLHRWQMPQGGIDPGEEPLDAAIRELYEETNITSIAIIARSKVWLTYDLPPRTRGRALKGRFAGQRQKWFVVAFQGNDDEINVTQPGGGHHRAEFSDWKWVDFKDCVDLIVPFKRHVYEALVEEFGPTIQKMAHGSS